MTALAGPMADLEAALAHAYATRDSAEIARVYAEAGDRHAAGGALDAACFAWVTGYVFALEAGAREAAERLRARLAREGRESGVDPFDAPTL